jgi:L-threonylcarbamoyladenylate synthase
MSAAPIERAVQLLRAGELVAFPTETVYGLGGDARSPRALAAIYALKGRPSDHPLIAHVAGWFELEAWCAPLPAHALELARHYWPGPLTLLVPHHGRALPQLCGGLPALALRAPAHPLAQELLLAFGGPLAAPSANRFGRVSPTPSAHVRAEFAEAAPFVLEGGPCRVGLESTILDLSGAAPALLRPGAVPREELEELLGQPLVAPGAGARAPGLLASHYAPRARVQLVALAELGAALRAARAALAPQRVGVLLGERERAALEQSELEGIACIAWTGELEARAQRLYAALREADELGLAQLLAVAPEEHGLGAAIADRLRRAAGAQAGAYPTR